MVLETVNGNINLKYASFEEGNFSTVNGGIFIHGLKVDSQNSSLKAETINGSVKIELGEENVGVYYKLKTVAGKCSVNLPEAFYETKKGNYLKGSTKNYTKGEKNLEVHADSISGNITLE